MKKLLYILCIFACMKNYLTPVTFDDFQENINPDRAELYSVKNFSSKDLNLRKLLLNKLTKQAHNNWIIKIDSLLAEVGLWEKIKNLEVPAQKNIINLYEEAKTSFQSTGNIKGFTIFLTELDKENNEGIFEDIVDLVLEASIEVY